MHREQEEKRLAALKSFELLDTETEERFDRITRLATRTMGTRIALVSLIDSDRQWFKSCQGLNVLETERSISFCTHAIEQDDVFVVLDAHKNDQFKDNPLVTGEPFIRFYAGAQLTVAGGENIGTLCIIDPTPRETFSDEEKAQLRFLASLVMDQANARLLKRKMKRQSVAREQAEALLEAKGLELHEQRLHAEFANRTKTEFLANVGHELKTPLNAIIGFSDLMLQGIGGTLSDQHQEYMRDIVQSGHQLRHVIEQILAISRYDPDAEAIVDDVAPGPLLKVIVDNMQHQSLARRVTLDLQGAEEAGVVETDARFLAQVLRPVIDNAVKFSPGNARVRIVLETDGHDALCIHIEDDGPGIPLEKLKHVFEPFFQIDGGLNRVLEGTGLGLTVAKQCADRLGIDLMITNRARGGTCVLVRIPRRWTQQVTKNTETHAA